MRVWVECVARSHLQLVSRPPFQERFEVMMRRTIALAVTLPLLTAGAACSQPSTGGNVSDPNAKPMATVRYACQQGKTVVAQYFEGKTSVAPGGMPVPGGRVSLALSDGRRLVLPQTLSGSGIRYANTDESFVFWSKGDTAFVEEGANRTQTYVGCVAEKKSG
jgi:membrane-bound inhibitor of C-type lysozyme